MTAQRYIENTAEGQQALRAELMAKATALVPLLRAKAAETERARRIPDEVLAAIEQAGLFRMRAPKRFGGMTTCMTSLVCWTGIFRLSFPAGALPFSCTSLVPTMRRPTAVSPSHRTICGASLRWA